MEKVSIFSYLDYRNFIKEWIKHAKSTDSSLTQEKIASSLRVKGPFLSKVMRSRANFSEDQIFLIANFFDLNNEEREYLSLLSSFERCGLSERKNILEKKIRSFQSRKLSTQESIPTSTISQKGEESLKSQYYLDPYHLLVHVALSIDKYSYEPEKICELLPISKFHIHKIIENLKKMQLIYLLGEKIILTETQIHLKKNELLCSVHQTLLRNICLQRTSLPKESDYNLAITFSCTEHDKEKIKSKFLDFLTSFDKTLNKAKDEAVFQMNFDLFRWL